MRASGCALLLLAACTSSTPEVEVRTYVGDTFERRDPTLQRDALLKVFRTLAPAWLQRSAEDGKTIGVVTTSRPARTQAEFDALVDELRRGPIDDLAGPAHRLTETPADLWPAVRAGLLAERSAPKGDYRALLAVIGGDVPNRYGHFALTWKKAHGHAVLVSEDWFGDLLAIPKAKLSVPLLRVYRDCVLQTALLRAAMSLGRDPDLADHVVETLLDVAYHHHGTFRDEVSRALAGIGDEALPALIVASADSSGEPQAALARFILDKMDRLHPARTLAHVRTEPRVLARVIEAYGQTRVADAAEPLLDFVDDRSPTIRAAARVAFERYVVGPAPRAEQKQVRLLRGETATAKAALTYRGRAALAVQARLAAEAPDLLEAPCELYDEHRVVDPVCEAAPERQTAAYVRRLDERRREREDAAIQAALGLEDPEASADAINRLLAENPELHARATLVEFFRTRGVELEAAGDRLASAVELRKAAMLASDHDPDVSDDLRVRALLNEAHDRTLPFHGREMLLRTAFGIRPADLRVQHALRELDAQASTAWVPAIPKPRHTATLPLLGFLLFAALWMGVRARRWVLGASQPTHLA